MGQRSQIFVRFEKELGEKEIVARYFNWNYGERMISRVYHTIDWIKRHFKLPIYHENGSKYFNYSFNEDMKCSSFPLVFLITKTIELFNQLGYTNELEEISLELNLPKESNHSADYHAKCLLRISFLYKDDKTKRPSELYLFDMNGLKWIKKGEKI